MHCFFLLSVVLLGSDLRTLPRSGSERFFSLEVPQLDLLYLSA